VSSDFTGGDFTITYQGVSYVLFEGLLLAAHDRGALSITTRVLQFPTPENGHHAICQARVTTDAGAYSCLGNANPGNTKQSDPSVLLYLAQVRAKAHAICDALNLNLMPFEDVPGYVPEWARKPNSPPPPRSQSDLPPET
jgi:hypothetical protein